jgi:tetratricopeptide (TPR) repeat protein
MGKLKVGLAMALAILAAASVFGQAADTVRPVDTVFDTVVDVDTVVDTIAPKSQYWADRFYKLAEEAIHDQSRTNTFILSVIGLAIAALGVFLARFTRRASERIELELNSARKDVTAGVLEAQNEVRTAKDGIAAELKSTRREIDDELTSVRDLTSKAREQIAKNLEDSRSAIEKEVQKVREQTIEHQKVQEKQMADVKKKAREELGKIVAAKKNALALLSEVEKSVGAAVEKAEEKAKAMPDFSFDDTIKLITEADAEESVKEYENLLIAMGLEGIPLERIPASLHRNVGLVYVRLERWQKAIKELRLYLEDESKDQDALFWAAYAYGEMEKHEEACEYWEKVTEINPNDAIAYYNWANDLSEMFDRTGQVTWLEQAFGKYEKATAIDDQFHEAYHSWAGVLISMYKKTGEVTLLEQALEYCEIAITIDSKSGSAHYNKACVWALLENKQKMLESLAAAIKLETELKKYACVDKDKDFEKYRDDPDFIALTKED